MESKRRESPPFPHSLRIFPLVSARVPPSFTAAQSQLSDVLVVWLFWLFLFPLLLVWANDVGGGGR